MSLHAHPEVREQACNACCECTGREFVCVTHISLLVWHCVHVYLPVDVLTSVYMWARAWFYVYPSLCMRISGFVHLCLGTQARFSL